MYFTNIDEKVLNKLFIKWIQECRQNIIPQDQIGFFPENQRWFNLHKWITNPPHKWIKIWNPHDYLTRWRQCFWQNSTPFYDKCPGQPFLWFLLGSQSWQVEVNYFIPNHWLSEYHWSWWCTVFILSMSCTYL